MTGAGIGVASAKAEIAERLADGRVQAVAHRAFVSAALGERTHDCLRISRGAWRSADIPKEFWAGKNLVLPRTGDIGTAFSLGLFQDGEMTCIGVRIDPFDIELIIDDHRQAQAALTTLQPSPRISQAPALVSYNPRPVGTLEQIAPELRAYMVRGPENVPRNIPTEATKPVSVQEFDAWHASQPPEVQAWGGAKLRQKCSEDHGGRRVIKKATDHITKGRKTGRKPGSKNVPR